MECMIKQLDLVYMRIRQNPVQGQYVTDYRLQFREDEELDMFINGSAAYYIYTNTFSGIIRGNEYLFQVGTFTNGL